MMDEAKVIQVIETTLTRRGNGDSIESPIRIITQYWSLEGKLLAEVDPWLRDQKIKNKLSIEEDHIPIIHEYFRSYESAFCKSCGHAEDYHGHQMWDSMMSDPYTKEKNDPTKLS